MTHPKDEPPLQLIIVKASEKGKIAAVSVNVVNSMRNGAFICLALGHDRVYVIKWDNT